jgi:hypothetical protein
MTSACSRGTVHLVCSVPARRKGTEHNKTTPSTRTAQNTLAAMLHKGRRNAGKSLFLILKYRAAWRSREAYPSRTMYRNVAFIRNWRRTKHGGGVGEAGRQAPAGPGEGW